MSLFTKMAFFLYFLKIIKTNTIILHFNNDKSTPIYFV